MEDISKIAILARVCPEYRLDTFTKLLESNEFNFKIFIGEDQPNSKVRSALDLSKINYIQMQTKFIKFFNRMFYIHVGLKEELEKFKPNVILCEGESNLISYIRAIFYKAKHNDVRLIHWSLGGLPGKSSIIADFLKGLLHRNFDAFLTYSSYGKLRMIGLGHKETSIFVATNVCNTEKHLRDAEKFNITKTEARKKLGLDDKFTVLYVGTIDKNKKLISTLQVAKKTDQKRYNYLIVGEGREINVLKSFAKRNNLQNVIFAGKVTKDIGLYYHASDVLFLPGRGGMVISEAMCYGVPVMVHEADGTEFDLVVDKKTGYHVKSGSVDRYVEILHKLSTNANLVNELGKNGRKLIIEKFNNSKMVDNIKLCIRSVCK